MLRRRTMRHAATAINATTTKKPPEQQACNHAVVSVRQPDEGGDQQKNRRHRRSDAATARPDHDLGTETGAGYCIEHDSTEPAAHTFNSSTRAGRSPICAKSICVKSICAKSRRTENQFPPPAPASYRAAFRATRRWHRACCRPPRARRRRLPDLSHWHPIPRPRCSTSLNSRQHHPWTSGDHRARS